MHDQFPVNFRPTGDPFVDTGGMALKYWKEKSATDKTILDMIKEVTEIYVHKWDANLHAFYLGSKITHKVYVGRQKITETLAFYGSLLSSPATNINCRLCGNGNAVTLAGRDQFCLVGSKAFVNFHSAHEKGIAACASCAIKLLFLPLATLQLGGRLALLQSLNPKTTGFWMKITVQRTRDQLGLNTSDGILKYRITNPQNALFQLATEAIESQGSEYEDQISLYYFTNFAAKPDSDLYILPNRVFRYLGLVINKYKAAWRTFVRRHYHIKKAEWDYTSKSWQKTGKTMEESEFANCKNTIYLKLLNGESILPQFRDDAGTCLKNNQPFEIMLAVFYTTEVLKMDQKSIQLLKKIADTIIELGTKNHTIKRYLVMIEGAGKAHQLRTALLKVIKDHLKSGATNPMITLDDYIAYLFPDGRYWGEVRDLLLIYLYEKLYTQNIDKQILTDIEAVETDENDTEKTTY